MAECKTKLQNISLAPKMLTEMEDGVGAARNRDVIQSSLLRPLLTFAGSFLLLQQVKENVKFRKTSAAA